MKFAFFNTANAVRTHLTKTVKDACKSFDQALETYGIEASHPNVDLSEQRLSATTEMLLEMPTSDKVACIEAVMQKMDLNDAEEVANMAFYQLALKKDISSYPSNFAEIASNAMVILQEHNKPNIVYNLAKCLGTYRPGTTATIMPINRMPFGLLEYQIQFFSCTNTSQVAVAQFVLLFSLFINQ